MPLYISDYLADTIDLSAEQTGCYLLILMISWRRPDGAIPNDMAWLKRSLSTCVTDMHGNRFNRIVPPLLQRFFTLDNDGKFRQKRLTKEREKAEKFSEKQSENAEKRWTKNNKNKDLPDANAMPAPALQSQSHTQPQSRKERTRVNALADPWTENDWNRFWDQFPNKVGKADARKSFEKATRKVEPDVLFPALLRYVNKTDDRPFCNPSTWLNQERWSDEPAVNSNGHRNSNTRTTGHDAILAAATRKARELVGDGELAGTGDADEFSFGDGIDRRGADGFGKPKDCNRRGSQRSEFDGGTIIEGEVISPHQNASGLSGSR